MWYKIKRAFRNLKHWLPIILKDDQFQEDFMFIMLYKKLELMEEFFRSDNTSIADAIKVADEIQEVREALGRVMENDYYSIEERAEDRQAALKKAEERLQRDLEIVFDGMKKNSLGWWD
ncbi:hypothetical protein QCM8_248 [Bacillus phage QCM8]|nr:hypothetical protein QCM8_248 [Bacillus phage QCM8]